jgi:ribosome-associated protein
MGGLERHIDEYCAEHEIEILRRSRKPHNMEDEWRVIDLGPVVIHLMNNRARDFYELERLFTASPH